MKKLYLLGFLFSIISFPLFSQYFVDFEDGVKNSYGQATVNLNGIDWDMTDALINGQTGDYFIDTKSARLRGYGTSSMTMLQGKANGIGNISFKYRAYGSGSESQVDWKVEYSSDNGLTWTQAGASFTATGLDTVTFSENVQVNAPDTRIRIVRATTTGASNARLNIDNITLTDFGSIVTITDTIVSFVTTAATTLEGSGTYNLNLKLNQATTSNVTVDVDLLSGNSSKISNTFPETVTFTAGTTTASLTINLVDDTIPGPDEVYEFIINNMSTGSQLGSDSIFTLTVNDDDTPLPHYTIATLRGANTDGQADSLGVVCKISGTVLGVNYGTGTTQNFYIHDGTAGMGVYIPAALNTFGYTINEGDSIEIKGKVEVFRGQTQLGFVTSIVNLGTGTVPSATTVTELNESTEGEVVKLENVTVVTQSSWGTDVVGGYDVEVTDGTNNFIVRIDADVADLYGTALPGCKLDISGIGAQFASSTTAPFTDGYRVMPRYAADINVIEACAVVIVTIGDATEVDTQGEPLMLNQVLLLKGIITSPDFRATQNGAEFTFADGTGGIWAYTSDSLINFDPIVGDSVAVYGKIGAANGVTRIYIDSVFNLGAATPFTPTVITGPLGEEHEAELITIQNLTLTGVWNNSGGSYNTSATSNGITYDIRVDVDRADLFADLLSTGDAFHLTGVGSQFDATPPRTEGYQILPRFAADIDKQDGQTAIKEISLNNFIVNPVPATDVLNIAFDYDANEMASLQLVNVLGKVVIAQNTNLVKGFNKNTIDVSSLNAGFYVLQVQTSKGVSNTNILVK